MPVLFISVSVKYLRIVNCNQAIYWHPREINNDIVGSEILILALPYQICTVYFDVLTMPEEQEFVP